MQSLDELIHYKYCRSFIEFAQILSKRKNGFLPWSGTQTKDILINRKDLKTSSSHPCPYRNTQSIAFEQP
jgi:hypothetical protein